MHHIIDFENKLSFEDHMLLYCYDMSVHNKDLDYTAWHLEEKLIHAYNDETDSARLHALMEYMMTHADKLALLRNLWDSKPWEVENPVIWTDRSKSEYYISNLEDSHKLEVYADYLFRSKYHIDIGLYYGKSQQYDKGENKAGIEVKCDKMSVDTGNYYFEYQERLNPGMPWVPSGILKQNNTRYYLYGVVGNIHFFPRNALKQIYDTLIVQDKPVTGCRTAAARRGTSKGFLVTREAVKNFEVSPAQIANELGEAFQIH